jgi:hypothetical protein
LLLLLAGLAGMRQVLLGVGITYVALVTANGAFDHNLGSRRTGTVDVNGGHL